MTFSDNFITIMDELGKRLGIAIDWTSANVLPYLQDLATRLVKFEIMTSIAWIVIMPVVTAIFAILAPILHKKAVAVGDRGYGWKAYDVDTGISWIAVINWLLLGGFSIATVCVIGTQIFDIIQAITFPEKTIFEYISSLLNNGQA